MWWFLYSTTTATLTAYRYLYKNASLKSLTLGTGCLAGIQVLQQGVLRSWCCCLTCRQTACCPELKTLVKYHHLQNALNHGSRKSAADVYPQGQTRLVRLDQVFTLSLTVLRDQIERRYQAGFLLVQSPGHIFVSRALAIIIRVWYE